MIEDILKGVLGEKSAEWIEMLKTKFGFDPQQAEAFIPAATDALASLAGKGGIDLSNGIDPSAILAKLNLDEIGAKAGVSVDKAKAGMDGVLSDVASSLGDQAGGLGDLLANLGNFGGGDASDALGKLGDMFGK